ncbi:unnamed protein product [Leptidea sinapis]|uniref:Uncharacterized protein n=1 Tax=Leptidea sinapis TaxID=189913 RepID=A0A5E4QXI2_9NEOP|nr:unnamed protein product [Leptidea sinapis]
MIVKNEEITEDKIPGVCAAKRNENRPEANTTVWSDGHRHQAGVSARVAPAASPAWRLHSGQGQADAAQPPQRISRKRCY